jgi:DNA repair protein RadC
MTANQSGLIGEPDELKGSSPVRRGAVGKVPPGNSLAAYPTLLLDQKNRITHDVLVYKGTVNTVHIRVAEMFMEAVRHNSPSIIMSHNHPSGDPTPSTEDMRVTELLVEAGKLLDIHLLDHLVIGSNQQYTSLRTRGLGFPLK